MITITLPDGSRREFESAPTVGDVAASIGAGLAKAALAGKVDGQLVNKEVQSFGPQIDYGLDK